MYIDECFVYAKFLKTFRCLETNKCGFCSFENMKIDSWCDFVFVQIQLTCSLLFFLTVVYVTCAFLLKKCPFQSIAAKPENKSKVASLGNPQQLIKYLDRKYHACKNLYFLQGLFLASEAPELYEICLNYAKTRATKIIFFERHILETGKRIYWYQSVPVYLRLNSKLHTGYRYHWLTWYFYIKLI